MNPRASFIIPVFNGAAYVAEGVKSCLESTMKDIEVIVVDDFSTDYTVKIVEAMQAKDDRIKIIRHGANMGRSAARNTGIQAASSGMLLMMDHDDISLLARAGLTLSEIGDADIAYAGYQVMDELGRPKGKIMPSPFSWERVKETKLAYIGHSTMAFKRHVFEKVQYTNGEYSSNGIDDWKFQVDAYKAGLKFRAIQKCLAQYRVIEKKRDEAKIMELKRACLN